MADSILPSGSGTRTEPPLSVAVPLPDARAYTILIGDGLRRQTGSLLAAVARGKQIVVVTQPPIQRLWEDEFVPPLTDAGFSVETVVFPNGERAKNLRTLAGLYDNLYNLRSDRQTVIVALGGGVVGDVAGFLAASYLRGLDLVQIPTTLLAMVDSSVGGKTGVDFQAGKNLIGAFHQPRLVLIDTDTLATLPARDFRSGLAEIVKYGVIRDPRLLAFFLENQAAIRKRDRDALRYLIQRSCEIKAQIVAADEREETNLRAILNYGHTIGHALEAATKYRRFRHGEAIAIGMISAASIGEEMRVTASTVREQLVEVLRAMGLPVSLPPDVSDDDLRALLLLDKKAVAGRVRFVLARQAGEVYLEEQVPEAAVAAGLRRHRRLDS